MLAPLLPMSAGHYILRASVICGARHGSLYSKSKRDMWRTPWYYGASV